MRTALPALAGLFTLVLTGCGRHQEAAPPPSAPAASGQSVSSLLDGSPAAPPAPAAAAAPAAPAADAAPAGGSPAAPVVQSEQQIIESISAALQAYYLANVNSPNKFAAPATLDALVKGGQLRQIPSAPAGKKIVYHPERWEVTIENAK